MTIRTQIDNRAIGATSALADSMLKCIAKSQIGSEVRE